MTLPRDVRIPDFLLSSSTCTLALEVKRVLRPSPDSVERNIRDGLSKLTPSLLDSFPLLNTYVVCLVVPRGTVFATLAHILGARYEPPAHLAFRMHVIEGTDDMFYDLEQRQL